MRIKIKRETSDYRVAQQLLSDFKEKGTTYLTFDFPSKTYTVESWIEVKTESEFYRGILAGIETETQEEQDAIAYADSAIKTLVDMGVIK